MARRKVGDVLVLIPGITGSVLARDGRDVWAVTPGAVLQAVLSLGRNVKALELTGPDDWRKPDLGDGVTAPRLVSDVHLVPGFWKIDGYTAVKKRLFDELTLTEGKNWFEFPYDWRRDNRAAALRLAEQAPRWLDAWRRDSGNADAKLVLIGHSMGGLVARHYLEVLDGWKDTRHLVTFGTPYRGSLNAVDSLVNGFRKGFGPLSVDMSRLLRSLTSIYQLLPVYPVIARDGSGLARVAETDLPSVDRARAAEALTFHRDIEAAVTRHLDDETYLAKRYGIHPVVGIYQPTNQSAVLKGKTLRLLNSHDGEDSGGDGTVPRVSATPIELSDDPREVYVTAQHGALQNADAVLAHVVGALTRKRLDRYRATAFDGFSLRAPDVVHAGEDLEVQASTAGPAAAVVMTVTDVDTGRVARRRTVRLRKDGTGRAVIPPLPEGIYRVAVHDADQLLLSVSDLLTVLGEGASRRPRRPTRPGR